ncbi:MAG: 2-hydroxychromene-2-carboxylate isomerase [Myxococcales bacterium]|nr:2-hydroxychromene-2-carboxylate isomerase [Myxococcales bacterium]
MTRRLEFLYDFSCPYAYLASTQVRALAERTGAELVYEPFLLGGVFKALGGEPMASMAPARARLNGLDMYRWAEHWRVPLVMPPGHPNRTVLALRATLASDDVPRASHALFDAYWAEGQDLSRPEVVERALTGAGFDGAALVARADDERAELFARTERAVELGVFGAPAFVVEGELYWGQDRLDQVERALGGTPPAPAPRARRAGARVDFWYDFSSPFAYLASTAIEGVCARTGAELRFRPFLLGGLFKAIGTPDVPLFSFPEAKRRYFERDLQRAAAERGVTLRFPSGFPIRTVLPLRLVLVAGHDAGRLTHALYRAAWRDDRDIADPEVLAAICAEQGQDPALVERAGSEAAKRALRESTDQAVSLGLCGAPSFVVDGQVYWGQDRLAFVERALGTL